MKQTPQKQTRPMKRLAAAFRDPRVMQAFEENVLRLALEENEVGARCRLALRLQRDNAPAYKQRRAIAPLMRAFVNLLFAPKETVTREDGSRSIPIVLRGRKTAKRPS